MGNNWYFYHIVFITRNWYWKIIYNRKLEWPYKWKIEWEHKLKEMIKFEEKNKCLILSFIKL